MASDRTENSEEGLLQFSPSLENIISFIQDKVLGNRLVFLFLFSFTPLSLPFSMAYPTKPDFLLVDSYKFCWTYLI